MLRSKRYCSVADCVNQREDIRSITTVGVAAALILVPQFVALPSALTVPWILVAVLACCRLSMIVSVFLSLAVLVALRALGL